MICRALSTFYSERNRNGQFPVSISFSESVGDIYRKAQVGVESVPASGLFGGLTSIAGPPCPRPGVPARRATQTNFKKGAGKLGPPTF